MFRNVAKQEIKISAEMRNLAKLRDFVGKIGDKYRFETKATSSLKLVVDEICTNIIRHGYRDVKNGEILLRAIVKRLSLTLVIIDRGVLFEVHYLVHGFFDGGDVLVDLLDAKAVFVDSAGNLAVL